MIHNIRVPVIVDEVNEEFTRVSYFTIEDDYNSGQWYLKVDNFAPVPFLMIGLHGIILGSNNFENNNLFLDPYDFETIFLEIEKNDTLSISISSLIIPNDIIRKTYRGAFLRISQKLFELLVNYNNNWSIDIVNNAKNYIQEIELSKREEEAFEKWCDKILSMEKLH